MLCFCLNALSPLRFSTDADKKARKKHPICAGATMLQKNPADLFQRRLSFLATFNAENVLIYLNLKYYHGKENMADDLLPWQLKSK